MSIFELLSFDIVEFATSIEGILIIVGILFLIIGIVLLCLGKGKAKKANDTVASVSENAPAPVLEQAAPLPQEAATVTPVETVAPVTAAPTMAPVAPVMPPVMDAPTSTLAPQEMLSSVTPVESIGLQDATTSPVVEPVNFNEEVSNAPVLGESLVTNTEGQAAPTLGSSLVASAVPVPEVKENVVNEPVVGEALNSTPSPVETLTPTVESLAPTAQVNETENVNNSVVADAPVAPVLGDTPVTVYGGTSPDAVIDKTVFEEKPREIYGGANPLENTAPIPTNTVREAYGGFTPSSPVVEPVKEASTQVNVETPAPAPSVMSAPGPVVDLPASNPAVVDGVVAPTVPTTPITPVTPVVNVAAAPSPVVTPAKEEIETLEF